MNEALVLNKRTNRFVKVGTPRYLRLLREGAVDPPPPPPPSPEASAEPPAAPVPLAREPAAAAEHPSLKASIIEQATDIVRDNKVQFLDLSQRDTDKLLRRMMYEKLCMNARAEKKKKKKSKVKFKSRKVAEESSSSSSEEDSD
jgi:hypothetical protein